MKVVRPTQDTRSFDRQGNPAFELREGQAVVLFNSEANAAQRAGAVVAVGDLSEQVPRYAAVSGWATGRLLVPFIGGFGDAIVLGSCLRALRGAAPDFAIDVACPVSTRPIFDLLDVEVDLVDHPVSAEALSRYTAYACLEGLDALPRGPGDGNMALFARCLGSPAPTAPVGLRIDDDTRTACCLPESDVARVALAFTHGAHMRSYPVYHGLQVARTLIEHGMAVYLFGVSHEIGMALPDAPPRLCNFIDRTPDLATLAAVLAQMDAVVCPDSLFMHLAGALRRPTIGLFTATDPRIPLGYPTIRPLTAPIACSPCGATAETCPAGHAACLVPAESGMAPERVAAAVQGVVEAAVGQYH